jgi:hypothetical protein
MCPSYTFLTEFCPGIRFCSFILAPVLRKADKNDRR